MYIYIYVDTTQFELIILPPAPDSSPRLTVRLPGQTIPSSVSSPSLEKGDSFPRMLTVNCVVCGSRDHKTEMCDQRSKRFFYWKQDRLSWFAHLQFIILYNIMDEQLSELNHLALSLLLILDMYVSCSVYYYITTWHHQYLLSLINWVFSLLSLITVHIAPDSWDQQVIIFVSALFNSQQSLIIWQWFDVPICIIIQCYWFVSWSMKYTWELWSLIGPLWMYKNLGLSVSAAAPWTLAGCSSKPAM